MNRRVILGLGFFFLSSLFVPGGLFGKTYHFPATESLLNLEKQMDKLQPGDTLVMEPAEHVTKDGITLRPSGKPGKPITLKAKAKGKVVLDGMNQTQVLVRIEGNYLRVEGLTLKKCTSYGVLIKGNHIQLKDNEIIEAGHDGVKTLAHTRDIEVIGNRIVSPKEDGIDFIGTFGGKIRKNEIITPDHYGIFTKAGCKNILIEGNTIIRPIKSGIFIGGLSTPKVMVDTYECTDCQAVNNLVVGAGAHGVFAYGVLNGLIAHNTIIEANSKSGWGASLGVGTGSSPYTIDNKKASQNVRIVNNIVVFPKNPLYLQVEAGSINVTSDFNLYFGLTKPQFEWLGKGMTWEELKKVAGQEIHAIFKDPLFVNPSKQDFRLQSQSPAKGSGNPLEKTVEVDFSGNKRPNKTNPSLGAFE